MKALVLSVGLVMVLGAAVAKEAFAGGKSVFTLTVDTVARRAHGNLSDIRNSANNVEFLNVFITTSTVGGQLTVNGRNAAGTQFMCSTVDTNLINAARALDGDAAFTVRWNTAGTCTNVDVTKSSAAAPKVL